MITTFANKAGIQVNDAGRLQKEIKLIKPRAQLLKISLLIILLIYLIDELKSNPKFGFGLIDISYCTSRSRCCSRVSKGLRFVALSCVDSDTYFVCDNKNRNKTEF